MQRPDWAPEDVDLDAPSPARVYDALLGGSHNFEIDRQAAAAGIAMVPDLGAAALANRRFLARAVAALARSGIQQFIDLGAGIPTVGNTHEIAPEARVLYVDIDAVAVAHARAILADRPGAVAVRGDLRTPGTLLAEIERSGLIDLDQPVALLLVAVLHLIPDAERPDVAVAALRDRLAPGSHLVISHLTSSHRPEEAGRLSARVAERDHVNLVFRTQPEIAAFFGDLTLLEPGLTGLSQWRPDQAERDAGPAGSTLYVAGVGRKD